MKKLKFIILISLFVGVIHAEDQQILLPNGDNAPVPIGAQLLLGLFDQLSGGNGMSLLSSLMNPGSAPTNSPATSSAGTLGTSGTFGISEGTGNPIGDFAGRSAASALLLQLAESLGEEYVINFNKKHDVLLKKLHEPLERPAANIPNVVFKESYTYQVQGE